MARPIVTKPGVLRDQVAMRITEVIDRVHTAYACLLLQMCRVRTDEPPVPYGWADSAEFYV